MEITLRKGVFIIIGVIVLLVVILVFFGGINKIQGIWDEMFGQNIHDGDGSGGRGVCPDGYNVYRDAIGRAFEAARASPNTRCLVPLEVDGMNGNKLPDLGAYKIQLELQPEGVVIGVAKAALTPQRNCLFMPDDTENQKYSDEKNSSILYGIYPCVVGEVFEKEKYTVFKENWFANDKPEIKPGEFTPTNIRFIRDGRFKADQGGEPRTEDELPKFYFYKTVLDGKAYLCVIEDEENEDNKIPSRIPECSQASGPDYRVKDTSFQCSATPGNDVTYFFNSGEYYCVNKDPADQIQFCDGSTGQFRAVNPSEYLKKKDGKDLSCNGDGIPPNMANSCCCLNDGRIDGKDERCIRFDFPDDENTIKDCSDLNPPGGGKTWELQQCPRDIGYRVMYGNGAISAGSGGSGSCEPCDIEFSTSCSPTNDKVIRECEKVGGQQCWVNSETCIAPQKCKFMVSHYCG